MNVPLPSQIPAAQKAQEPDLDEQFGCFENMVAVDEAAEKARTASKKPFVRKPHLTDRAFAHHEGLVALKASLEASTRKTPKARPRKKITVDRATPGLVIARTNADLG